MPDLPTIFLPSATDQNLTTVNESGLSAIEVQEACHAWLFRSPSPETRSNYERDVRQFMDFTGIPSNQPLELLKIRPAQVIAWRDHLMAQRLANSSVLRKITSVRSLFSYLQTHGYVKINPAHSKLTPAPPVSRHGKTVALSADACRRLLEAPVAKVTREGEGGTWQEVTLIEGIRDRALLAVLAFGGCRVGELTRLKVGSYMRHDVHQVLEIHGKGGKERRVALHLEAAKRIETWLDAAGIRGDLDGPLFRPTKSAWGRERRELVAKPMTRRAVQKLIDRYIDRLGFDPNVSVHSLRVTALTTARERGSDIIDLQDFAGHADPRTTLTYIRNRDRLEQSPSYLIKY